MRSYITGRHNRHGRENWPTAKRSIHRNTWLSYVTHDIHYYVAFNYTGHVVHVDWLRRNGTCSANWATLCPQKSTMQLLKNRN